MSAHERYLPGVPCWIDLTPPDPDAAAAFYGGLFGWSSTDVMPAGAPGRYLMARLHGEDVAAIGSAPDGVDAAPAWTNYVLVTDADATAARAREAGGAVVVAPFDVGDSGRMALIADPTGAVLGLWQAGAFAGAGVVNEHGSLNFSDLVTDDLERAAAFYGAVLGWELLDVGFGSMWALPGYGDHLERRTPGTREGMAAMGAPERFEDVVARATRATDVAPHWGVTFAVDDADATAARAAELGGEVLSPPADAPWVRLTVIRDPQGAVFTASQFVPPSG